MNRMTRKAVIGELRELKHMFQRRYDKYPTWSSRSKSGFRVARGCRKMEHGTFFRMGKISVWSGIRWMLLIISFHKADGLVSMKLSHGCHYRNRTERRYQTDG